jgi:hypothetical protein
LTGAAVDATRAGMCPVRQTVGGRVPAAVVIGVLLARALPAAEGPTSERRTIAVTGQGEVRAAPDRVALTFAVETAAERAAEAVAENARRSAAVAGALKPLLAREDTVATTRYTVEPRYESPRPGERREPRITGYVVHNAVHVESRQVDKVGALIDAANGAGANRVGGLTFSLSTRGELVRTAIEKAGADARAQAESAAKGLGVRLKAVVSATVVSTPVVAPRQFHAMEMAAEARAAPTPVEPGELTVPATLQVTYEIE